MTKIHSVYYLTGEMVCTADKSGPAVQAKIQECLDSVCRDGFVHEWLYADENEDGTQTVGFRIVPITAAD